MFDARLFFCGGSPRACRWYLSTRFVGRNPPKHTLLPTPAEAAASAAKAGRRGYGVGTHLAFINGFTPVAFCEGG